MYKTAMVTGGSRGIGLGISKSLLRGGWRVAVCATRSESDCTDALAMLRQTAGADDAVFYQQLDVADTTSHAAALERIEAALGGIDLLVNNAGVAPLQRGDLLDLTEESYDRVMRINLRGPFFLTQAVSRRMIERRRTDAKPMAIVNISSISATVVSILRGEYCISKAGVSMATQLWAVRLAPEGIPVYEIRPGIIESDMTAAVREKYDRLIADGLVPQGRWGTPDDIGAIVTALAGGALPYATGQVILADGGQTIPRL